MKTPTALLAALLALSAPLARAETPVATPPADFVDAVPALRTVAGSLAPPFAYEVRSHMNYTSSSSGLTASDHVEFVPAGGPRRGQVLTLGVQYYAPSRLDPGLVASLSRRVQEEVAAKPETRSVAPLVLGGFDFTLLDTTVEKDGAPRRGARLMGVVNGALLNLDLMGPGDAKSAPDLVDALSKFSLDYAGLLRLRKAFDDQSALAVRDGRMHTAVGVLPGPQGLDARLGLVTVERDGDGRILYQRQDFGFYKMGFWAEQRLGLSVACHRAPEADPESLAKLRDPFEGEKEVTGAVRTAGVPIGGLQADRIVAKRTSSNGTVADVTHWFARDDQAAYAIRIERVNGRKLQRELEANLAGLRLACEPNSTLGAVAPAASAPGATEAPGAGAED